MTQVGVTSRNENDNPGELQAGSGIGGTPRQVGRVVRPVEVRKPGESQHNVATLQDEAAGRRGGPPSRQFAVTDARYREESRSASFYCKESCEEFPAVERRAQSSRLRRGEHG